MVRLTNYLPGGRTMHAAVVRSYARPPRYEAIDAPAPGTHEVLVDVLASGLHPRVRSSADGSHYTSPGETGLPFVPGIDGVGRTPDGGLLYFVLPDTPRGAMAEQTVVDRRRTVPLPAGTDVHAVAAGMNPAMSAWVALRRRVTLTPAARVLVLGATGSAGRLAVEVARHLGAGEVVGVARDAAKLAAVPADAVVALDDDTALAAAAADVDVVLDYLWGEPALRVLRTLVTRRADRSRRLDWVQIGAVAGPDLALPSAALRAADLRLCGSGQGSVRTADIVAELPALAAELSAGTFTVAAEPRPLREVESVWAAPATPGRRTVLVP
jgi:NADPH:quinone reductase-like Zn-dependent oxidoreductase